MAKKTFKIRSTLLEAMDDTVSSANNHSGDLNVQPIPLSRISVDPENPREFFLTPDDARNGIQASDKNYARKKQEIESLQSLELTINRDGILNPIDVYQQGGGYRLVAGERRTLASILAGKMDITAKIRPQKPDLLALRLLQWVENCEREDLTLWERLQNIRKICEAYKGKQGRDFNTLTATELQTLISGSLQQSLNYTNVLLSASSTLLTCLKNESIKSLDKAAFIAKADTHLQDILIEHCIAGATLKELKTLTLVNKKKMGDKKPTPVTGVNLGKCKKVSSVKFIIESVMKNPQCLPLQKNFSQINWDSPKAVTSAFQKMIKMLDQIGE